MQLTRTCNTGVEVALLLALFSRTWASQTITSAPPNTTIKPVRVLSNGTCESRTVNYITHSLPSVCLRNGRIGVLTDGRTEVETTVTVSLPLSSVSSLTANEPTFKTADAEIAVSTDESSPSPKIFADDEEAEALYDPSFLSFEDWKKQTQSKLGQDGEKKKRDGTQETLEAAEYDGEIDMDIHAIIGEKKGKHPLHPKDAKPLEQVEEQESEGGRPAAEKPRYRSKDAGKTCKERFNFASVDAGGQVMKSNPEAKSSSALLSENRDVYMLNICQAKNKFIIVELSDSIYVETVALANFEFFSSTFRQFRISVSAKYPVKLDKWITLGTFEASNTRDIQAFLVESPLIEARYLRVEFLNHYGNEFYCPVSLLRVHGQTMLQEVMSWERAASGEDDEDEPDETGEISIEDIRSEEASEEVQSSDVRSADGAKTPELTVENIIDTAEILEGYKRGGTTAFEGFDDTNIVSENTTITQGTSPWRSSAQMEAEYFDSFYIETICPSQPVTAAPESLIVTVVKQLVTSNGSLPLEVASTGGNKTTVGHANVPVSSVSATDTQQLLSSLLPTANSSISPSPGKESQSIIVSSAPSSSQLQVSNMSTPSRSSSASAVSSSGRANRPITSQNTQPATQESFFKTVTKRLQLLEANSTLSLKYIEDQSRILREAFTKVEKRQLTKTTAFLENLNSTVLAELRKFGQDYDQIWQSTVIELETQRDQSKKETAAVTARLNVLADELVFQKRMSIVQSILLLLCLAMVVFSRGLAGGYIDMPAIQSMLAKSRSPSRMGYDSITNSPTLHRNESLRNYRRWHGAEHRRQRSEDSTGSLRSRSRDNSPPTPFSTYSRLDDETKTLYQEPTPNQTPNNRQLYAEPPLSDNVDSSSHYMSTSSTWDQGEALEEDTSRLSSSTTANSPPRQLHTLRRREGSITDAAPRISIQMANDEALSYIERSYSVPTETATAADPGGKPLGVKFSSGEAEPTVQPMGKERPEFLIVRKPLPALPRENE